MATGAGVTLEDDVATLVDSETIVLVVNRAISEGVSQSQ